MNSVAVAQQPGWHPTRMPSQSDARPLPSAAASANYQASQQAGQTAAGQAAAGEGSGIVLRWKSVASGPAPAGNASTGNAAAVSLSNKSLPGPPHNTMRAVQPAAAHANGAANRLVSNASGWTANPLRSDQSAGTAVGKPAVRTANYQQQSGNDPFGDNSPALPVDGLPSLPQGNLPRTQPNNQPGSNLPELPSGQVPQDPLSNIELPPAPGGEEVQPEPLSPLPTRPQNDPSPLDRGQGQKSDPFGDRGSDQTADKDMEDSADQDKRGDLTMPKPKRNANTNSCNDMRERLRQMRLSDISLDVSPEYGEGLRARESGEKDRLDFAASAPIRPWTDYKGTIVATGRLIDLRDDCVVLDLNGREQKIPIRDLSDIDVAYVADAWNLPMKCGIGYEAYAGRQFIPSAVEWKASGLCHKPLYFEDVQLERYGHEVGPVLQPLISSAHFFGSMLILPYKMGVNLPGECQYSLGYYRPGDCAPYMIQPFPFSMRGAAVQAGFVTGAAALIP
jgi:hypothetical protein